MGHFSVLISWMLIIIVGDLPKLVLVRWVPCVRPVGENETPFHQTNWWEYNMYSSQFTPLSGVLKAMNSVQLQMNCTHISTRRLLFAAWVLFSGVYFPPCMNRIKLIIMIIMSPIFKVLLNLKPNKCGWFCIQVTYIEPNILTWDVTSLEISTGMTTIDLQDQDKQPIEFPRLTNPVNIGLNQVSPWSQDIPSPCVH